MIKRLKKEIAIILIFSMVFANAGISTFATSVETIIENETRKESVGVKNYASPSGSVGASYASPYKSTESDLEDDTINDYELMSLSFETSETPKFSDSARKMEIDSQDFTIYYSNECPYVEYEIKELSDYAKDKGIKLNFIKIDSLEKAKNAPCIFNNWANFYKGKFISNTILNANAFERLLK